MAISATPAPQPTSATSAPAPSLPTTSVQRRKDRRNQRQTRPRAEHPLGAMRPGGPLPVIRQTQTGAERGSQVVDEVRSRRRPERTSREEHAAVLVGENRRTNRAQLETVVVVPIEQTRGGLTAQPLPQPPLVQPGAVSEILRRERPGSPHGLVQTKAITEVDQQ